MPTVSLQAVLDKISHQIGPDQLGKNVTYQFIGQADNMKTTFMEMGQAIGLSLLLVYILLAAGVALVWALVRD